jgi:transcriptional regulator with XRE-family HTH domain
MQEAFVIWMGDFETLEFGGMPLRHQKRRADAGDAEIGRRLRIRRLEKGISQTELGSQIGVTFQQLQKYESGANRVAASRLRQIAEILEVPMAYFFAEGDTHEKRVDVPSPLDFLKTEGAGVELQEIAKLTCHTEKLDAARPVGQITAWTY